MAWASVTSRISTILLSSTARTFSRTAARMNALRDELPRSLRTLSIRPTSGALNLVGMAADPPLGGRVGERRAMGSYTTYTGIRTSRMQVRDTPGFNRPAAVGSDARGAPPEV